VLFEQADDEGAVASAYIAARSRSATGPPTARASRRVTRRCSG
jgi:hypothetical protein